MEEKLNALNKANKIKLALDHLIESEIFFICLKGFALSNRLYQDPSIRFSKDIDILVPNRNEVILLSQKLQKKGWARVDQNWAEELPRRDWYMNLTTHLTLEEPKTGVFLEIHWELNNQLLNISQEELKSFLIPHVEKMLVMNKLVHILSPELELLYLLVHGAKHAWFRLKWLVDIHHYPFHLIDRNKFEKLVEKFRLHEIIAQTDELLKTYFGKGFPFQIEGRVKSFLVNQSKQRIKDREWDTSLTLSQFTNSLVYNWFLTNEKKIAISIFFKTIFIRAHDIAEVKLDSYWKYYFYRYYSLLNRKVLKRADI